jgi:hypothetical protein
LETVLHHRTTEEMQHGVLMKEGRSFTIASAEAIAPVTASIRCGPFSRYDPFHVGQDHPLRGRRRACGHMASSHLVFDRGPAALAFCKVAARPLERRVERIQKQE